MPHVSDAGGHVVRRCGPADIPAVQSLLAAAGLPVEGAAEAFATGWVAAAPDGTLVGAAAVEPHGEAALLRSVVVDERARGAGVGRTLVGCAEDLACALGARELYLLTETAAGWFPRLGYVPVPRDAAPPPIAASGEFASACPASAVLMRQRLAE